MTVHHGHHQVVDGLLAEAVGLKLQEAAFQLVVERQPANRVHPQMPVAILQKCRDACPGQFGQRVESLLAEVLAAYAAVVRAYPEDRVRVAVEGAYLIGCQPVAHILLAR